MSSSISGSKNAAWTYTKVLLGICAFVIIGLEISSYYLLDHDSLTYSRISRQYERALTLRRAAPGQPPSVLIVGNSLLLHGIQLDRLRSLTSGSMRIYPIFLEATGYYDWLFGLRKIFHEGARPDVVVVGVGVNYFLSNNIRPDYTPMEFVASRDVPALASALRLDNTEKSDLWFSHFSVFWDTRTAIRTQILKHIIPHLQELFDLLSPRAAIPQGPEFDAIALPRLQRLRELCEEHGAKLILLVPPTLGSESAVKEMADAARTAGVDVSVPVDPEALSAKFFEPDGMHLNREGAVVFTAALAKDLPARLVVENTLAYGSPARTEQPVSIVDPKKPSE